MSKSVELSREEIEEQLSYYEHASMKRQQANAEVCRQLLDALDKLAAIRALLATSDTVSADEVRRIVGEA